MPYGQVDEVMTRELGEKWRESFEYFSKKPFAAASIGQVHKAKTKQGDLVCVKVQYPDIDKSIDSDIKNLLTFLRIFDILPKGVFVKDLLSTLKKELTNEVNYLHECENMIQFR